RLGVPSAGAQRVPYARDGERAVTRHLLHAGAKLRRHRPRVVDPLRDLHELSGVAKLRDDPRRNPKARRDSLDKWRRGARLAQDGVETEVSAHRLATVQTAQGCQQATLGEPPLAGVHRSRKAQRRVGTGVVPSTAIRMASVSSLERVCREVPFSTGLAKTRV